MVDGSSHSYGHLLPEYVINHQINDHLSLFLRTHHLPFPFACSLHRFLLLHPKRLAMRLLSILFISLYFTSILFGQNVGINTTEPKATLDVKASNQATPAPYDGLLIPQLDAFPATNPGADQNGMLIFLTTENTFYYWHNSSTSWIPLTNALIAVKKIDDLEDGKSDNDGTDDGSSIFLGVNAGQNDDMTNNANVGIGFESLKDNISGRYNTSVGYKSMYKNTLGQNNSAFGNFSLYNNIDGSTNTGLGIGSLYKNSNGAFNVAIGSYPMYENLNGRNNTAVGNRVLYNNTFGNDNTAIGNRALFNNTESSYLVAVGDSALYNNGIGATESYHSTSNTALGSKTLFANTIGYWNTASGFESLYSNTEGSRNVANGNGALYANTLGSRNTAIGNAALYKNTIGNRNTGIGNGTLYFNTTGTNNTAVGEVALVANTTGASNVALGTNALYSNTDKSNLVAVGDSTLYNNGIGASLEWHGTANTAIGSKALFANTIGDENTATGYHSLKNNMEGYRNSAFGMEALFSNSSGRYNVGVGQRSLYSNTEGSFNVAVGARALQDNISGLSNTALGNRSLYNTQTGDFNVGIGSEALFMNMAGNKNVAIGDSSGFYSVGSGNIFIGQKAGYNETGNNKLYVHNDSTASPLIYGEFDNDLIKMNGRVIIGDNNNSTPEAGSIRWNETFQDFEGYTGSEWKSLTYKGERWGSTIIEDASNTSTDKQSDDQFGRCVDVDGNWVIVGAPNHDNAHVDAGKAYFFQREGNSWVQRKTITASDGEPEDYFGTSVAISGDYAIVGAIGHDTVGQAYIFYWDGYNWNEQAILSASDKANGDWFGTSVSISGDYAIVGANGNNRGSSKQGKAYIFHRSGTSWLEEDILSASDGVEGDYFGDGVAISGDYAIVGASRYYTDGHEVEGKAYVFHRTGSDWLEESILTSSDGNQGDQFGCSISMYGDFAIIGAPDDWHPLGIPGKAYVFHRSGSTWTEQAKLFASDGGRSDDHFGRSVSIYGDYAIIGAKRTNDYEFYDEQGRAYIFRRSGSKWVEEAILQASDGSTNRDNFGSSVTISNNYAIVGRLDDKLYFFKK